MTIDRVLPGSTGAPLLGGLEWRPLAGKKHSRRTLTEAKKLTDATQYTLLNTPNGSAYGLYVPRASEDGAKLPKGACSAAAAFATLVGESTPFAALVLKLSEDREDDGLSEEGRTQRVYVVLLEDGIPVTDMLTDPTTARNVVGTEDRFVYSDDIVAYPSCEEVSLEWLQEGVSKGNRVAPIPVNPLPIIAAMVAVVMLAGGYYVHAKQKKEEEARRLAEEAAAADPVPKYLNALAAERDFMATDREEMLKGLLQMYQSPVIVPGWVLKAVECDAQAKVCNSAWMRAGGTFDDIRKARAGETLLPVTAEAGGMASLDEVVMQRQFEVKRATLIQPEQPLPNMAHVIVSDGPKLQIWKNATITVEYKPPLLWPAHPEVPQTFTHPQALMRGEVNVKELIAPFAIEALKDAPANVSWEKMRVDVVPGADAKSRLNVELTGYFYVSNQAQL